MTSPGGGNTECEGRERKTAWRRALLRWEIRLAVPLGLLGVLLTSAALVFGPGDPHHGGTHAFLLGLTALLVAAVLGLAAVGSLGMRVIGWVLKSALVAILAWILWNLIS
ncbi:MAG TPA: hypothetical protein VFQ61_09215 [Polyangiaceae bacterium]|nr:hypothetical protein [Polyangiaceae bacterium]